MRLAWFSPLLPVRSGISAYSAELLPLLARDHEIDVFLEADPAAVGRHDRPEGVRTRSAHDFIWSHRLQRYDLIFYQLGNAACHDYMWPYLTRFPGVAVLHDGQLHHARARRLLMRGSQDAYRAEFAYSHPNATPGAAELAVAGVSDTLSYFWPMLGVVAAAARTLVVHNAWLAADLRQAFPRTPVEVVTMGVPDMRWNLQMAGPAGLKPGLASAAATVRERHGIAAEAPLFAAFGLITPEKRIPQALRALAEVRRLIPPAHMMLVGDRATHYDVAADAALQGIENGVTITGYVAEPDLPAYVAAADVCLAMRWPTSRETSGSWLRCLAAGKPTILTDLAHLGEIPTLDPRSWTAGHMRASPDGLDRARMAAEAMCVSLDLIDEEHSLVLAMQRLALEPALRMRLGERAREWWARHHTLEAMARRYGEVMEASQRSILPARPDLPAHLCADGTALARRLLGTLGTHVDFLDSNPDSAP